jgi:NAD(P)-dependent dehydrogenase (short-subunit alcohol dehydrogenase family)
VSLFSLEGQAAIVTGASSGLGAIIADALADAGCAVVLAARREAELRVGAERITARGGRALARRADLRDPGHAEELVETALDAFGRLDGVVLNAGASAMGPAESEDLAAFADVLAVNVTAQMALAAAGARAMMDVSDGLVIDAGRLAAASGMRATVRLAEVPGAPGVAAVAAAAGREAAELAATGGEDFELLAALPPGRLSDVRERCALPLTVVGELAEGEPGVDVRDASGASVDLGRQGWEHDV